MSCLRILLAVFTFAAAALAPDSIQFRLCVTMAKNEDLLASTN